MPDGVAPAVPRAALSRRTLLGGTAALAVAGLGAWPTVARLRSTGAGGQAAVPTPADLRSLDDALARRAASLLRHDRPGWLSVADPGSPTAQAAARTAFERIDAFPVTRWQYAVTQLAPAPDAGGTATAGAPLDEAGGGGVFQARVSLTYRLAGDTRDVRRTRLLTVRRRPASASSSPDRPSVAVGWDAGAWWVESDGAATAADRDLWDLAPLTVARGSRSVVVGLGAASSGVSAVGVGTEAAARAVDAVWGASWPRTVVVVLPADLAGFAAVLGHPDGTGPDQLAAVTTGQLDRGGSGVHSVAGAADRVVLNPRLWRRLTETGRRVVLVHELTHVATRATTSATPPTWLDEGFAAYVGYRGAGLADAEIAADALPAVRAGHLPTALPASAAFDPAGTQAAAAYAQAWVACDVIARRAGLPGLVAVYRAAASGAGGEPQAAAALRTVLGTGPDTFIAQWRARLQAIARTGG